ncbi:MAG TPA: glycosyltransferase [Gammaproteobacteria bacterium]
MKVLHAFKVYKPHRGGIVSTIDQLAHAWPDVQSGVLACVSGSEFGQRSEDDGVPVVKAGSIGHLMSMPLSISYPILFRRMAKQADVIAYHYPFPLIDLSVAAGFAGKTGLVVHWHSEVVQQRMAATALRPLMRRCLERADRIIVSTPAHIDISDLLAPHRDKCEVIPFGVDASKWAMDEADVRPDWRERPPFLLAVGRLVPYKGFDVLLAALGRTSARLVLIGDGPERSRLEKMTATLGLGDRVDFLGDVDEHTLKHLMNACHAFVLPSVSQAETFGIVQLEVMSCGKPIINTDAHPGIGWVARDGFEALTVPAGNVDSLAAAIERIWQDEALAIKLGAAGSDRVRGMFSKEKFFEKVHATYEKVSVRRR